MPLASCIAPPKILTVPLCDKNTHFFTQKIFSEEFRNISPRSYDLSLALPTRSYSSQGLYGSVELELCCRKDGGRAKPKLIKL